jgi:hypothetical protein
MRRRWPISLVAMLVCGCGLMAPGPAAAAPGNVTITGVVTNGRPLAERGGAHIVIPTGLPHISGALVSIAGTGIRSRTGRGGAFVLRFAGPRVDRHFKLEVRARGLGTWTMRGIPRYSPQGALYLYVQLGSRAQRIAYVPPRLARAGRVPAGIARAAGRARASAGCSGFYSNTTPPSTIRVYMTGEGDVQTYNFQFYVEHVLPHEWPSGYDWNETAYEVGAMSVKNYGWFMANGGRPGTYGGQCYDVNDTSDYQVFEPNQPTATSTNDAVAATWDYRILKGSTIFEAPFDCSMRFYYSGENSDCYPEPCGYEANGEEMSQYGSQACAEDGDSWQQILHIYYSHITIASTAPPGDGSFVSFGGRTYRVVGGYPLLVTDCGGISGGCGSPTPVSSLGAYRSTIANGTALYETDQGTGGYFSALGGTIVHVTSCAGSDAVVCRGGLQVNYASIAAYDQAHPTIANGTAIVEYDHAGGAVFSALGGTIVHVTSCSGQDARVCAGEVQEPYDTIVQYIAAHPRIANGTAIVEYDHAGGAVFSALGGTIVHVTSCSGKDTPVCAGEVQEPYDTIADYVHQHPRIANGTAIVEYDQGTGAYWSAIGGTIVHVTSCSGKDAPICHGAVQEPFDTIAGYIRQHPTIANSTVLYELDHGTGAIYKAAGGTLLHVTSCSGKDTPVCPGSTQENYATIAAIIHHHPLINPGTILHYQDHPPNAYLIVKHKTLQKTTPTRKAILLPYKTITTYAHQHHLKIKR